MKNYKKKKKCLFCFCFQCALRQWCRGNIGLITITPVPECLSSSGNVCLADVWGESLFLDRQKTHAQPETSNGLKTRSSLLEPRMIPGRSLSHRSLSPFSAFEHASLRCLAMFPRGARPLRCFCSAEWKDVPDRVLDLLSSVCGMCLPLVSICSLLLQLVGEGSVDGEGYPRPVWMTKSCENRRCLRAFTHAFSSCNLDACIPQRPSPCCCGPSSVGDSDKTLQQTAGVSCGQDILASKRKLKLNEHTNKQNLKGHHSRFASTCGRRLSSSCSIFRASQGFFQRGCWAFHVRLPQCLPH